MTRDERISLRDTESPGVNEREQHIAEPDDLNLRHGGSRQCIPNRGRACVLLGSAILQMPIWGFAMSWGVFQEYFSGNWTLEGGREATGVIGTTSNGVMYISMPFLFALFTRRWAHRRQTAALCGAALTCISFLLSSFSTHVWHLVATQGVLAALGCALIYSPMTLSLGEWFSTSNRAVAYGIVLSCKNIVGSACPFILRALLDRYDFRVTLRIWVAIVAGTSVPAIFLVPTLPSILSWGTHRAREIPWQFLRHHTIYVYSLAIILQSCGYGIPQTYLNTYAHEVTLLSQNSATLLLTLFNIPGIFASSFFGYLTDNKHFPLSAPTVTAISAVSSALSAFLFWGLTSQGSMALLVLFSTTFGFFAGGYSATWGGIINELEYEAAQRNEAIDTGMIYGLLNGARGIGYVSGGLASVPLLQAGSTTSMRGFGYGTTYGPLIVFTGLSSVFGGWGLMWKWNWLLHIM
ncbi:major facilitator superfamily domain-containing protein [Xylariaceae sp. FL0662B]|nr:major facilitator superfamily domain-containing protein [Xylariaceae sp. FL0662B]